MMAKKTPTPTPLAADSGVSGLSSQLTNENDGNSDLSSQMRQQQQSDYRQLVQSSSLHLAGINDISIPGPIETVNDAGRKHRQLLRRLDIIHRRGRCLGETQKSYPCAYD